MHDKQSEMPLCCCCFCCWCCCFHEMKEPEDATTASATEDSKHFDDEIGCFLVCHSLRHPVDKWTHTEAVQRLSNAISTTTYSSRSYSSSSRSSCRNCGDYLDRPVGYMALLRGVHKVRH